MVVTDYNEQFLDKRGTDHLIEELKAYINGISTGDIDLSDYVTKAELQAKLDALDINIDLSPYATKEELTQAINSIDLSSYATKSEIPSLDGYATTEYVDNAIANVPSGGGTTDLSNYYTKDEVYSKSETDALIPTVTDGVDGADGITPHIDETTKHWMIGDTDTGVMAEGVNGTDGIDGTNGTDGVSPTVTVTKEGKVATITCTEVNGTTTATISDGAEGSSSGGGSANNDYTLNTEVEIGTYFGKTLYRKVVQLNEIKVGTHKIARTSIVSESIDVKKIGGQFINAYSEKMNIPFFESTSSYVSAYLTDYDSNIAIISKVPSTHGSAWAYGYLYIEYTKNS